MGNGTTVGGDSSSGFFSDLWDQGKKQLQETAEVLVEATKKEIEAKKVADAQKSKEFIESVQAAVPDVVYQKAQQFQQGIVKLQADIKNNPEKALSRILTQSANLLSGIQNASPEEYESKVAEATSTLAVATRFIDENRHRLPEDEIVFHRYLAAKLELLNGGDVADAEKLLGELVADSVHVQAYAQQNPSADNQARAKFYEKYGDRALKNLLAVQQARALQAQHAEAEHAAREQYIQERSGLLGPLHSLKDAGAIIGGLVVLTAGVYVSVRGNQAQAQQFSRHGTMLLMSGMALGSAIDRGTNDGIDTYKEYQDTGEINSSKLASSLVSFASSFIGIRFIAPSFGAIGRGGATLVTRNPVVINRVGDVAYGAGYVATIGTGAVVGQTVGDIAGLVQMGGPQGINGTSDIKASFENFYNDRPQRFNIRWPTLNSWAWSVAGAGISQVLYRPLNDVGNPNIANARPPAPPRGGNVPPAAGLGGGSHAGALPSAGQAPAVRTHGGIQTTSTHNNSLGIHNSGGSTGPITNLATVAGAQGGLAIHNNIADGGDPDFDGDIGKLLTILDEDDGNELPTPEGQSLNSQQLSEVTNKIGSIHDKMDAISSREKLDGYYRELSEIENLNDVNQQLARLTDLETRIDAEIAGVTPAESSHSLARREDSSSEPNLPAISTLPMDDDDEAIPGFNPNEVRSDPNLLAAQVENLYEQVSTRIEANPLSGLENLSGQLGPVEEAARQDLITELSSQVDPLRERADLVHQDTQLSAEEKIAELQKIQLALNNVDTRSNLNTANLPQIYAARTEAIAKVNRDLASFPRTRDDMLGAMEWSMNKNNILRDPEVALSELKGFSATVDDITDQVSGVPMDFRIRQKGRILAAQAEILVIKREELLQQARESLAEFHNVDVKDLDAKLIEMEARDANVMGMSVEELRKARSQSDDAKKSIARNSRLGKDKALEILDRSATVSDPAQGLINDDIRKIEILRKHFEVDDLSSLNPADIERAAAKVAEADRILMAKQDPREKIYQEMDELERLMRTKNNANPTNVRESRPEAANKEPSGNRPSDLPNSDEPSGRRKRPIVELVRNGSGSNPPPGEPTPTPIPAISPGSNPTPKPRPTGVPPPPPVRQRQPVPMRRPLPVTRPVGPQPLPAPVDPRPPTPRPVGTPRIDESTRIGFDDLRAELAELQVTETRQNLEALARIPNTEAIIDIYQDRLDAALELPRDAQQSALEKLNRDMSERRDKLLKQRARQETQLASKTQALETRLEAINGDQSYPSILRDLGRASNEIDLERKKHQLEKVEQRLRAVEARINGAKE